VLEHIRPAFKVFLEGLDLRNKRRDVEIVKVCNGFFVVHVVAESAVQMESAVVGAFVEFVTKLNDTAFRPLFRKLFDWAFTSEPRNVMYHRMRSLNCPSFFSSRVNRWEEDRILQRIYGPLGLLQGDDPCTPFSVR
jgi:hypothetical protein